jgi:hypothetical protein
MTFGRQCSADRRGAARADLQVRRSAETSSGRFNALETEAVDTPNSAAIPASVGLFGLLFTR